MPDMIPAPVPLLRLRDTDQVAVALRDLAAGEPLGIGDGVALEAIARGHKVALSPLRRGEIVRKLGLPIGVASSPISRGAHVHTHNLAFAASLPDAPGPISDAAPPLPAPRGATFDGYLRPDGRVGTRNVMLVLSTVNCSATVVRRIGDRFRATIDLAAYPSIDGVVALTHQHGCSVRADGPGMDLLRRTLAGYANHPNVAAVLVVGLGCEDNQVEGFLESAGLHRSNRLATRIIQDEGGSTATIDSGVAALHAMLPQAAAARRQSVSAEHLVLGLQCGGSDGFSAISANPVLGRAADLLVAEGGTAILSETPELHGAESLLLERTPDPAIAARLLEMLHWWDEKVREDGGTLDSNPSPGNRQGGITTILEKSLGAIAKGGSTPLRGALAYAERCTTRGLVFMDSPGYDPVSATGQVAAGANLICFTTGRGSCFGSAPAPAVKVATNTPLFRRMAGDMDLNAGTVLDGHESIGAAGDRLFALLLDVASGRRTRSEELGYGEEEFAPWTPGLMY